MRLHKVWDTFENIAACTFLFIGIGLIFYGVVMRYILDEPHAWIEEVANYTIIWGALLGVPVALRNNHHIQIEMLYDKMPNKIQRIIDIFANSMGTLFSVYITYYGYLLVEIRFNSGLVSIGSGIPMWVVYLIIPIFGIMFLCRFIQKLLLAWKVGNKQAEGEVFDKSKDKEGESYDPHSV